MFTRKGSIKIKDQWAQFMACIITKGVAFTLQFESYKLPSERLLPRYYIVKKIGIYHLSSTGWHPIIGFNNEVYVFID